MMFLPRLIISTTILALLLSLGSCAGYKVHQVEVRPPDLYSSSASDECLCVGADPLDNEQKVRAIFNTDLNKAGFLAVNVIIRNDGKEAFKIDKNQIYLVDRNGIQLLPTSAEQMIQSAGTSIAKWYFISKIIGGLSANAARKKMRDDFINKGLIERVVPSGISVFGFLYYQHSVDEQGAKGYKIIIVNSLTGQPLEVPIN
jgi:hypothetical protein